MKEDRLQPAVYRVSSQFWFRPALAILLAIVFVLPGGQASAELPIFHLMDWLPTPADWSTWLVMQLINVVFHLGCALPLWLATSGRRRIKSAVERNEISREDGQRCDRIIRWALVIMVGSFIVGAIAATSPYAELLYFWLF
jgi:hypothetical protein